MQAGGQVMSGLNANEMSKFRASQLRERANERKAVAQREAENDRRMGDLIVSRGATQIAMQGGNANDAQSVVLMARLEAEKEYQAMSTLYKGYSEAQNLELQADITRAEGRAARTAGLIGAASTALQAAGKWFEDNPGSEIKSHSSPARYSPVEGNYSPVEYNNSTDKFFRRR